MGSLMSQQIDLPFLAYYRLTADIELNLIGCCDSLARLLGFSKEEIGGKKFADLIESEHKEIIIGKLYELINSGKEIDMFVPLVKKDGNCFWVFNRGQVILTEDGTKEVHGVLVVANDSCQLIEEQKELLEQYEIKLQQTQTMIKSFQVRAEQDSLTCVFNARTTRELCEEYLSEPQKSCAIIVIDVDDFKRINDRYGHMVGDSVLVCATAVIKRLFRSNDIVGRIGGDEFLVLMKDVSDRRIVELRCSQIVESFNEIKCKDLINEKLGCSVGAALSFENGNTYDTLFCTADRLMYRCKRAGGSRFIVESE